MNMYVLARGPLFKFALTFFFAGMLYRLANVIFLGWDKDYAKARGSKGNGVIKSFLRGNLILPFIPRDKRTFDGNPIAYLAGGFFHISFFIVFFFGAAHMLAIKSLTGKGWATLPQPIVDWTASVGIISLIALFVNRKVHPATKRLTGLPEYINLIIVFLPMLTGYMLTHHMFLPYQKLFGLHMFTVDLLLIWIPLSRISHFIFYFFSRTIHGVEWGKRGAMP